MKVSELIEWPVIWADTKSKAWRLTQYAGLATSRGYQTEIRGDGSSLRTPGAPLDARVPQSLDEEVLLERAVWEWEDTPGLHDLVLTRSVVHLDNLSGPALAPGEIGLVSAVHVGEREATRYDEPWEAQVTYEGRAACVYAQWSTLAWLGFLARWPQP